MEFTKQQLTGGAVYGPKTKLGNYSEDLVRVELESKDYELKKERGELLTLHKQRLHGIALQKVPHSHSEDGKVRFGDNIMLRISEDDFYGVTHTHYLANNIWDTVDARKKTVSCSATNVSDPVARNVFVVTPKPGRKVSGGLAGGAGGAGGLASSRVPPAAPPPGSNKKAGEVLCYGDVFCLASNPSLRVDPHTNVVANPYYLMSERPNNILGSGKGNMNEVCMGLVPDGLTLWTVMPTEGDPVAFDGLPVPIGADITILHRATNQPLGASIGHKIPTTFGHELYVHAFRHTPNSLSSSSKLRPAQPQNRWQFVLSDDPRDAVDDRGLLPLTPERIVDKVRETVRSRGAFGLRGLSRAFRVIDDAGDGVLDREDFKWGLYDFGIRLSDEEFDMVLSFFDRDGNGVVSFNEFLVAMRGGMSEARKAVVRDAYNKLDVDCNGVVTLADVRKIYTASSHPDVMSGRKSEDEALLEFVSLWDTQELDGVITLPEFEQYYEDVSSSIDGEEYFVQMVKNAWQLPGCDRPGGDGALKIRVSLKTGRVTDAYMSLEVQRAFGVHAGSGTGAIVEALEEGMGVLGVYRAAVVPEE